MAWSAREVGVEHTDPTVTGGRRTVPGRWRAGTVLLALAVLGGLALSASGGVGPSLRTEEGSYQPGDRVELQLRNGLRPAGYNLCFAFVALQRQGPEGWDTVAAHLGPPTEDLVACRADLRPLWPLGRVSSTVHLPSDLPSGAYRLVHGLEIGGDRRAVATDPFTVDADG
jgi:hypothetical protein